LKRYR